MTIAAGFCYDDGLLLCADSMHTSDLKLHRPKIFMTRYEDGLIAFALAGHEGYAKMAIQDCTDAILACEASQRSVKTIKRIVRNTLRSTYVDHIDMRPPHEQYDVQIALLVAVWSKSEGLH